MKTKSFDAVQFMREVRDRMSADMQGMSFEEMKVYIEQRASKVREELSGVPKPQRTVDKEVCS
jgi:hypothetical protein